MSPPSRSPTPDWPSPLSLLPLPSPSLALWKLLMKACSEARVRPVCFAQRMGPGSAELVGDRGRWKEGLSSQPNFRAQGMSLLAVQGGSELNALDLAPSLPHPPHGTGVKAPSHSLTSWPPSPPG